MVKHIVMFKLEGTPEQRRELAEKFRDALLGLPEKIEVLQSMEVGLNENPAESWDLVLIAQVKEMQDVKTYAEDEAHVAAAGIVKGHVASRACVDYND